VKEKIKKWGMSSAEIKAYKLAVIWEDLTQKMFPDVKLAKLPKRGDPRKGSLFKYCWKLQRELNGIIEEKEYRLYITGNLVILKNNNGRIDPNAICGEKAWKRWKISTTLKIFTFTICHSIVIGILGVGILLELH
jgi:hypothetical protein